MKLTVVITGGEGDIALAIKDALLKTNEFVVFTPSKEVLNVTNIEQVAEYFKLTAPDYLINCAGYINSSGIKYTQTSEWQKHFDINITGAFNCSKYAIINNNRVTIINIGSSAGLQSKKNWSAYCCSKRALSAFTECLSLEGVKALSISPGRTNTKMRRKLFPFEDKADLLSPKEFAMETLDIMFYDTLDGRDIVVKKEDKKIVRYIFEKEKFYV